MRRLEKFIAAIFFVLNLQLCHASGGAGGRSEEADRFSIDNLFERGRYEASFNNGALFSPFIATLKRPTVNYTMTEVQFGYMLTDFKDTGFFRGNFEVAGEGFGSGIFVGPGSYIAGVTLWGRYNFVRPGCRWVPYAQAGAGMVSTDIDRGIVGQPFNFNLDLGAGVRWFIRPQWALNFEYRFQHISNANTGKKNLGINADGPVLGISYLF
ncbi:MAG TPA: acyloxyacyl hydrolase [Candidatus Acidoferrum sp.]|jgi:hypothetical protein|nr:acyloxyacyl hydrolase [Candidatus Acidoferrum sp.]